jgi:hypothetical protein
MRRLDQPAQTYPPRSGLMIIVPAVNGSMI